MIVVPRLLIRNPAIPSQRRVVPSVGPNASPPNGCVLGLWLLCLLHRSCLGAVEWVALMVACFVVHLNAAARQVLPR